MRNNVFDAMIEGAGDYRWYPQNKKLIHFSFTLTLIDCKLIMMMDWCTFFFHFFSICLVFSLQRVNIFFLNVAPHKFNHFSVPVYFSWKDVYWKFKSMKWFFSDLDEICDISKQDMTEMRYFNTQQVSI